MKAKLLFVLLAVYNFGLAQEDAWIFFTDKPNESAFFSNPLSELSQRSLDRRTTQNIPLDTKDAPLHQPYIDQITASTGITVLAKSKWLNMLHVRGNSLADVQALSSLAFVDHIQYANHSLNPGGKMDNSKKFTSTNKWLDTNNTNVNFNYGNSATQVQMLNCHILHQQNYTGAGKIVAILDAGFPGVNTATPFQRLRDNGLILGGYNFVTNSTNFYTGNSHGTNVLSTMGGYATNLVGTAPDAKYYLFITEDVASETPLELSNWIEGAEEADRLGVDVINTSLGYFGFDNPAHSYTYAKMNGQVSVASRAVDIAFSRGMICVISAGNEGNSSEPHVGTPADATFAVTVGSVTSSEVRSGFSSIGPTADLRIKPDLMAMGTATVISNTAGTITTANGTSFSSPILAGAITSFWSAFPNKKNSEIVQLVKQSADRYSTPDNNYGYGIPDFQLALNNALATSDFDLAKVKVYPNPSRDIVSFDLFELNEADFTLSNSLGQTVLKKTFKNEIEKISLENMAKGIYYYTITSSEMKLQGKLVKE